MSLEIGTKFPDAKLVTLGSEGPMTVDLSTMSGRRVVVFGLPGAFTGPCSTAHLPSFIRTADDFRAKGIDEIICVAVNDPFVLKAWGEATGADGRDHHAGRRRGALTKTLGMDFTAPPIGLYGRSNRYAVVLDDGVVTHANIDQPNVCDISRGEQLLETL
jgi:peroxiredoxin